MCRVFGCVSAEPVSIRHELLEAENPMISQSEHHDSGWGMAVVRAHRRRVAAPRALPRGGARGRRFLAATAQRGRIFNVHVRRATMGGLTLENTHPFTPRQLLLGHNGTVLSYPRLIEPGVASPPGRPTPSPSSTS